MSDKKPGIKCIWCGGSGEECGCGYGSCAHCDGTGLQTAAPFGSGSNAKMSDAVMSSLASEVTDARIIGTAEMVQLVARRAANRDLPESVVEAFVAYWDDHLRNATLGEYIFQIAELAESDFKHNKN